MPRASHHTVIHSLMKGVSCVQACTDANVQNFPTWVINGQTVEGDWPLEYLAGVLDGADPKEEAKKF